MWDKRVYQVGDEDLLACAVDAHVRELAQAMGIDAGWKAPVMWGEAYTVGTLTVMYVGQRSAVTGGILPGMQCAVRSAGQLAELGAA